MKSDPTGGRVLLAHGGGGTLSRDLLERVILPPLSNPILNALDDAACVSVTTDNLVVTTDSYVVDPLFFPGGNIGTLAVCGTINDLTMQGATPKALTCALIIEEGLQISVLSEIVRSLGATARDLDVPVVAGDTKVVPRGKGGGLFINTAGFGVRSPGVDVGIARGRPGDTVIVSGTLGDHGIAVMNEREDLGLRADLVSDVAPLNGMLRPLLGVDTTLHCLRDPTRGGLTTALADLAAASRVGVRLRENSIPLKPEVRAACRLLGLDPLNVANEGKAVLVCPPSSEEHVIRQLRAHPLGQNAAAIGTLTAENPGIVLLETAIGGERILTPPAGHDLPRIC